MKGDNFFPKVKAWLDQTADDKYIDRVLYKSYLGILPNTLFLGKNTSCFILTPLIHAKCKTSMRTRIFLRAKTQALKDSKRYFFYFATSHR